MKRENIVAYVNDDLYLYFGYGTVKAIAVIMFIIMLYFSMVCIITHSYFLEVINVLIFLIYFVIVIFIKKNCKIISVYEVYFIKFFSALYFSLSHLFYIYLVFTLGDAKLPIKIYLLLVFMWIISLILVFLITLYRIYKGSYINKKPPKGGMALIFPMVGLTLGKIVAGLIGPSLNQYIVVLVLGTVMYLISFIFQIPTVEILKCYFMKKYVPEKMSEMYDFVIERENDKKKRKNKRKVRKIVDNDFE